MSKPVSSIYQGYLAHFPAQSKTKNKKNKNVTPKRFLIFPGMELSSSNIKKIYIFLKINIFLYFRKRKPVLPSLSPQKTKNPPRLPNFLYFRKWNFLALILKLLYFLKRKLFFHFQKQNHALFRPSPKNKRNPTWETETELSYILGKGTFEPQA